MAKTSSIALLAGDGRWAETKLWADWLRRVPSIRRKFCKWSEDFDPFYFNEAASVAVLANAASQAGYLALTEYVAFKRHTTRGRPFRHGRCDLWVADVESQRCWAFEFKQQFATNKIGQETFNRRLRSARTDAEALDSGEGDYRVGCLITVPHYDVEQTPSLLEHYDMLCASAELAFRVDGGARSLWFGFTFVPSRN